MSKQKYIVMGDVFYNKIFNNLKSGKSKVEYTHISIICPHDTLKECKCKRNKNILKDDKIFRIVGKKEKIIYKYSYFIKLK